MLDGNSGLGTVLLQGGDLVNGTIQMQNGADLAATSAGGTLDTITLQGTLDETANGSSVTLLDGLTLNGEIDLGNTAGTTYGKLLAGNTETITGTGSIVFRGGTSGAGLVNLIGTTGASTLTFDTGISVRGNVGTIGHLASNNTGSANGVFINKGIIQDDVAGGSLTLNATSWNNQGTWQALNGGALVISATNWTNAGTFVETNSTVTISGSTTTAGMGTFSGQFGQFDFTGSINNVGASLLLPANFQGKANYSPQYYLTGGTITGGVISTAGGTQLVATRTGGIFDGVTFGGTLLIGQVLGTSVVVKDGLTLLDATINVEGNGQLQFSGSQSLTVGWGDIGSSVDLVAGDTNSSKGLYVPTSGNVLTIGAGVLIHGETGIVGTVGGGTITNLGTIDSDGGGTIVVPSSTNFSGSTLTGGTWEASGSSILQLTGDNITTNAANIILSSSAAHIYSSAGTTNALANFTTNAAAGSFSLQGGVNYVTTASFTNAGFVTIGSGNSFAPSANGTYLQTGGTTSLSTGTLGGTGATVNIFGGNLSGPGTVIGNVTNAAEIDLGSSPGALNITGTYKQTAAGTLAIKVGGATPGTQFDQVNVSGSASLNGRLNVSLVDGFAPVIEEAFEVLNFASSSGEFSQLNSPLSGGQPQFVTTSTGTNLSLVAATSAPDLAVSAVTLSSQTGSPGQNITIAYQIDNLGTIATVQGAWTDSIYLSPSTTLDASATLVGRVTHTGNVAGLSRTSGSLTAPIPGIPDASYYIIVVTDSGLVVPDVNRANDTSVAPLKLTVKAQTLQIGTQITGTIANGQDIYFELNVVPNSNLPAGADLQISATLQSAGSASILERYAAVPDSYNYDVATADPTGGGTPSLKLTQPKDGIYYIVVQGQAGAGTGESYSLLASPILFQITGVSPNQGSNLGNATVTVTGSQFTAGGVLQLQNSQGAIVTTSTVQINGSDSLSGTFNLIGVTPGVYNVILTDNGKTITDTAAFTVLNGNPGRLVASISVQPVITPGENADPVSQITSSGTNAGGGGSGGGYTLYTMPASNQNSQFFDDILYVNYSNPGSTDIPAPILVLNVTNAYFNPVVTYTKVREHDYLASLSGTTTYTVNAYNMGAGSPNILPPGYHSRIPVFFEGYAIPHLQVSFSLSEPNPDKSTPIDWTTPNPDTSLFPGNSWDAILGNYESQVGTTYGGYETWLANMEEYTSSIGEATSDINQLEAYALQLADDPLQVAAPVTSVDAAVPVPGLPLTFKRTFQQTISGRYTLGTMGYGWTDNWDISATTDTKGNVTVFDDGVYRQFTLNRGSYTADAGDHGVLMLKGTGATSYYTLQEADGTTEVFNNNASNSATLNFVEDRNNNKITACYNANNQLLALTDSSGATLTIGYRQGEISTITDSSGRVTSYGYDGLLLTSVQTPFGSEAYSYTQNPLPTQQNSLATITYPDGSQVAFNYDVFGRLISQVGSGLNLTFSYGAGGQVEAFDATGDKFTTDFNPFGEASVLVDPLGNTTAVTYDSNGNPVAITYPDGTTTTASVNSNGNLSQITDPLGNAIGVTYDPHFTNEPGSVVSYQGQIATPQSSTGATQFGYYPPGNPNQGDLKSITSDGADMQSYTYNAQGQVLTYTNGNGQVVTNAYFPNGLLQSQSYPDGSHNDYAYDSYGNLKTASNSVTGLISLTYNTASELTKVSYPDGHILAYTYNSNRQRTQMVDDTGFTVNYNYDSQGRLISLTDANNAPIVVYGYDTDNRLASKTNANGTLTTYAYDAAGNLKSLINYGTPPNANQAALIQSEFLYSYDQNGRLKTVQTLNGTTQYGYNADGELETVSIPPTGDDPHSQSITYNYDSSGNRTSVVDNGVTTDYTVGTLNEYSNIGGNSLMYDAAGNLKSITGSQGTMAYSYDALGRVTNVTQTTSTTNTWSYAYDALGNLGSVTYNGQTTTNLTDPTGIGSVVAQYNGTSLSAYYTQSPFGLVSQTTSAGNSYFYGFDASGNTAQITDRLGDVTNTYDYLPFGEVFEQTGTLANPFTFVGQFGVMSNVGPSYFMRNRFYDQSQGRFIEQDPLGIGGGSVNLYEYAGNDPNGRVDPNGTSYWDFNISGFLPSGPIPIGPGLTGGIIFGDGGHYYLYWGFGGGTAGPSGSITWSPDSVTTGPNEAIQVAFGPAVQVGNSYPETGSEGAFAEFGVGTPGVSVTLINVFDVSSLVNRFFDSFNKYTANLGVASTTVEVPIDPNDIVGPSGYGTQQYEANTSTFSYTINFENEPTAGIPAQVVAVTQELDSNLDWSTFQLGSFNFGGDTFSVPAGLTSFTAQIDARSALGVYVDVSAFFDEKTGLLTWTFISIDPTTLDIPVGNPLEGFLPPDATPPQGQAWVSYTVQPKATDTTGTLINAQADVIFQAGLPDQSSLETAQIFNTIDAGSPTSTINALPSKTLNGFTLSWTGQDDAGGSGIADYNIYVSDNGGAYTPLLLNTTSTSTTFTGNPGDHYSFYSVAIDNVGNQESTPTTAEATTLIDTPPVLSGIENSTLVYSGIGSVAVTASLTPSDQTSTTLASATVQISGGYQAGADSLLVTNVSNIVGNWNAGKGVLELTGTDTLANYQSALQSIQFQNTGTNSTARTISFQVNDGLQNSTLVSRVVDAVPRILSLVTASPNPGRGPTEQFTLTFSEPVTGVVSTDFSLAETGTVGATQIQVTPVSTSVYTVTVSGVTGNGTLGLNLVTYASIVDAGNNSLSTSTTGPTYTIDTLAPTVQSINRANPSTAVTNASSVSFTVTFSEPVTGVDSTAFSLAETGTVSATLTQVTPVSPSVYTVTVSSITGIGTLGLNLLNNGNIADLAGNPLNGSFTGQVYTMATVPAVTSQPTNETVTSGALASFTATASGLPTPTVQWQSSPDGTTWTNISGATSTTYSFTTASGNNSTEYRAVFTNVAGTVTTNPATLTVTTRFLSVLTAYAPNVFAGLNSGLINLVDFQDSKGTTSPTTYAATINWGDGHIDSNIPVAHSAADGTTIHVLGSHTYTTNGTFHPLVTLTSADGASLTTTLTNTTTISVETDVSSNVSMTRSAVVKNRTTGLYYQTVTITNISGVDLTGDIDFALTGLTAGVTLANASGSTSGGTVPWVRFSTTGLAAGKSLTITLSFSLANSITAFNYGFKTYNKFS